MLSTIALKEELSLLFKSEPALIDVYANLDFSFEQDRPVFTILCKDGLDIARFYHKLIKLYPETTSFYATCNNMDSVLQSTKIIWRKGVWYV